MLRLRRSSDLSYASRTVLLESYVHHDEVSQIIIHGFFSNLPEFLMSLFHTQAHMVLSACSIHRHDFQTSISQRTSTAFHPAI